MKVLTASDVIQPVDWDSALKQCFSDIAARDEILQSEAAVGAILQTQAQKSEALKSKQQTLIEVLRSKESR